MDAFLAKRAQQRSLDRGTWYQEAPSLIRKRSVFAETKAAKKDKKTSGSSSSSSSGSETDGGSKKDKKEKKKKKKKKGSRCWSGYEPVEGKAPYSDGSCKKA